MDRQRRLARSAAVLLSGSVAFWLCACSPSPASLSEAAEKRANAGGTPELPFAATLVRPLPSCSAVAAHDAMVAGAAATRAAGALCAATLPCADDDVSSLLDDLSADAAVAAEHVDRGTILGGGDQRVQHPVSEYARYASQARFARTGHCANAAR